LFHVAKSVGVLLGNQHTNNTTIPANQYNYNKGARSPTTSSLPVGDSESTSGVHRTSHINTPSLDFNAVKQKRREFKQKCSYRKRDKRREYFAAVGQTMRGDIVLQSEETSDTAMTASESVRAENILFKDDALSQRISMGNMGAGDYDADADVVAGLGEYLSRPVRIYTLNWTESTFTQAFILPWHLFFNTPQIKKKLDNFSRISCELKLKFVINASPFYYGSLRACYFPLTDERSTYTNVNDQIPFSQAPGVYLEPQNMTTAEMTLPFLWTRNWLDATAATDFQRMGTLFFLQYANLRSANSVVGTGITVSVYAWAENVKVMGPSTAPALQSSEYEDNGTISAPATAIADFAEHLDDVPIIGPFATATSIGARAVAGIAKMFGYSNPPMIDDVPAMQNKTFHAFANVETRMPIDKLSIDPKNEVTISSRVAGIEEEDALAFAKVLTHESFLVGALWANSNPVDTLLWSAVVTPTYFPFGGGYYTSPPISYFSRMFRYWRGSIVYKFRFIKTKYHTGRLIISYDPGTDLTTTSDTETTTFTRIVDLSVEDEVEVIIPYKATSPWLSMQGNINATTFSNGTSPVYSYDPEVYNGTLSIRVQNILTGPASNPQIDILSYVRAGDDFMFSVPTEINTAVTPHDPAGVIQSSDQDDVITQQAVEVDKHVAVITTGELISSLRPLLHRVSLGYQQLAGTTSVGTTAGIQTTANYVWRIPRSIGRSPDAYGYATVAGSGVPYNFAPNHPIDWVLNCYVGVRGSTNLHVNATSNGDNVPRVSHLSIQRYYSNPIITTTSYVRNGAIVSAQFDTPNQISRNSIRYPASGQTIFPTGQTGVTVTNTQGQPAVSANMPQYSRFRFTPAFFTQRGTDPKTMTRTYDEAMVTCQFTTKATSTATTDWPVLSYYYSAGVDFQPVFFLCTPRLFTTSLASARDVYP